MISFTDRSDKNRELTNYTQNWQPIHTAIVMAMLQKNHVETVATEFGYHPVHIRNLMRTPQARKIREQVQAEVLKDRIENFDHNVAAACVTAFDNMMEFINNKEMKERNPFGFFDKNLAALNALNKMKGSPTPEHSEGNRGNTTNNVQVNVINTPEVRDQLSKGLESLMLAQELHKGLPSGSIDGNVPEYIISESPNPQGSGDTKKSEK